MASEFAPENMVGHRVLDTEGHNVGKIKQVYVDERTGEPTWASVHTGLFGLRETLVPLQGAQPREEDIQVPYDKATVKEAPNVDADERLSPEDEALVRDYFARNAPVPEQARSTEDEPRVSGDASRGPFADAREGRGDEPEGRGDAPDVMGADLGPTDERFEGPDAGLGPTDEGFGAREAHAGATGGERMASGRSEGDEDVSMVRHEEQVDIGVERRESGEATMHRRVESERFDETVPLHHEELEVERRPIQDPSEVSEDTELREDEASFTLHEERPTVSKKEVPVEEVRVRKRDVTRQEHVEGERRTERIEFDEEDDTRES